MGNNMKKCLSLVTLLTLFALLLGGCGDGGSFTPAEKTEVDRYIQMYGRKCMPYYLQDATQKDFDENRVLKYINYFASQGADVNASNTHNTSPLHYAIAYGNFETVTLLVSKGADVNAKDNAVGLGSPLHWAVSHGNVEIVKFLVSKGANVSATLNNRETPLDWARGDSRAEIREFLISKGAVSGEDLK